MAQDHTLRDLIGLGTPPALAQLFADCLMRAGDASSVTVTFSDGSQDNAQDVLRDLVVKDLATRASVGATQIRSAVDWVRTMGGTSIGDGGGGLYKRATSEPSHPGKLQSADGAWWELTNKTVTLEMFGGRPDARLFGSFPSYTVGGTNGTLTDNYQPFLDALAYLKAANPNNVSSSASGKIELLLGKYYISQPIDLHQRVMIVGQNGAGTANSSSYQTELVWPENTAGIYVNRHNTSLDTTQSSGTSADGTYIGFVALRSLGGGGAGDRTKHGIRWRARGMWQELSVINFPGHGIDITATQDSSDPAREGNANYMRGYGGRIENCHHGINVEGTIYVLDPIAREEYGRLG